MNFSIGSALLACIIGAIVYFVIPNAKAQELGRLSFACGLLAFLFTVRNGLHLNI